MNERLEHIAKLKDDWDYLLTGNAEERLAKARAFRKEGRLP